MYASLLKLIRSLRRWKRRAAKVLGKDSLEALWEIICHVVQSLKNLSGIPLIVPIVALLSVPVHFTSKDFSWKSNETGPFPKPKQFILGVTGILAALLIRHGVSGAWLKTFGLVLAASILSPIWLLVLAAAVLLVATAWRLVFVDFVYQRNISPGHYLDGSGYLILFSVNAWRRIDWPKFYYFLCYFWIYAAITISITWLIFLLLWDLPYYLVSFAMHVSRRVHDLFSTMSPSELREYLYSQENWRDHWLLLLRFVPLLVILPSVRFFLRPYVIMFCNCLKIPTELSFDTQFRELNERSRLLLQVDMAREARIRLIASVRTSTRAAIRAVRRQERRARRWNLTGPYLEERTVYGLNFRAVTTYLNRKSDSRLLADIERILAGRPLLDCTSDSGPLAGQLSSIPFASEDVEICDRDTPDEQVLDTTNPHLRLLAQTVEMRPPGLTEGYILAVRAIRKSHRQWIIEAVRAIRRSYRQWIAVSVIALSFAILGYLGAAHWKHERDREREIQGQITGQHEDYAKRFFNDIYSGQDPCSDPVLVTLIPKPEECRKALESCYHVPHVDICGAPSVSEVFPNRKVCDDVASDTYPVCPPTSDK